MPTSQIGLRNEKRPVLTRFRQIPSRITFAQHEAIQAIAKAREMTYADWVRDALDAAIQAERDRSA